MLELRDGCIDDNDLLINPHTLFICISLRLLVKGPLNRISYGCRDTTGILEVAESLWEILIYFTGPSPVLRGFHFEF